MHSRPSRAIPHEQPTPIVVSDSKATTCHSPPVKALCSDRAVDLRDVPPPSRPNECRVRVILAGICGTALQILNGDAGFEGVPGHEFVDVVEDVSSDADSPLVGCRVVGEINVGCGKCKWCHGGTKEHCPARSVLGIRHRSGAFAEYLWLPSSNLHVLPESLDASVAVFVEPTAAACQILTQTERKGRMQSLASGL